LHSYWQKITLLSKGNIISIPEINLKPKYLVLKSEEITVTFKFIDYLKKSTHDKMLETITDLEAFLERHSIKINSNKERSFVNREELNHK